MKARFFASTVAENLITPKLTSKSGLIQRTFFILVKLFVNNRTEL